MVQRLRSTLVVTTFNWPAALDLTLRSIARQSVPPGEVIVRIPGAVAPGIGERIRAVSVYNLSADHFHAVCAAAHSPVPPRTQSPLFHEHDK